MRNIKRKAVGAVAAILMTVGIGVAFVAPASANTYADTQFVHLTDVCRSQGSSDYRMDNPFNPYSAYCVVISTTDSNGYTFGSENTGNGSHSTTTTNVGGLDINAYCQKKYGGDYVAAVVNSWWGGDWYCVR